MCVEPIASRSASTSSQPRYSTCRQVQVCTLALQILTFVVSFERPRKGSEPIGRIRKDREDEGDEPRSRDSSATPERSVAGTGIRARTSSSCRVYAPARVLFSHSTPGPPPLAPHLAPLFLPPSSNKKVCTRRRGSNCPPRSAAGNFFLFRKGVET